MSYVLRSVYAQGNLQFRGLTKIICLLNKIIYVILVSRIIFVLLS